MPTLPSIFNYDDYRDFILDYIDARKKQVSGYGRKAFARAIGFSSDAGLNMVLSGKRELRPPYLDKCTRLFKLSAAEQLYFEAMARTGALTPAKRLQLMRKAELLVGAWTPPPPEEGIRIFDFFVVHQILCLHHSYLSVAEIQARFRYPVTLEDLKKILEWMAAREYVERAGARGSATYKILKSTLSPKDEYPNGSLRRMHIDAFRLAETSLSQDPIEDREFQTFLFTIDRARLGELKKRVKSLMLQMISEFETDLDASTVVQFHMNLLEAIQTRRIP